MIVYLISCFIFSLVLTWLLVHDKLGINFIDFPNNRSLHSIPTPRSGGLAIIVPLLIIFLVNISGLPAVIINIVVGAAIVLVISVFDDIKHVPSLLRLCFHFLAAGWLVYSGLALESIVLPGGKELILPEYVSWIITILIIIWMTNLYNFMDGMDGFAGGMTVVGFAVFAWMFFTTSQTMAMASLLIIASTLGFLCFNFPPAKIFMGDSGSSVLGYLAAAMMLSADKSKVMPLWLSVILFSPFIIDATITLLLRVSKKQKFWVAHKQHFYQRLVESGWSHRKTVLAEYCLMLVCGALVMAANHASVFAEILIVGLFAILYIGIIIAINIVNKTKTREVLKRS
jgi:UDP-N-acetylmuramyl pentapeptide phosphotransferase/UDP-N-acetylglucosamine-1-phosphate transferase